MSTNGVDIESHELWYDLAVALANNHVPGFQMEKRGNDPIWTGKRREKLNTDVREIVDRRNMSVRSACQVLSKREGYQELRLSGESLRDRYKGDKSFFEDLRAHRDVEKSEGKRPLPILEVERGARYRPSSGAAALLLMREARKPKP